MIKDDRVLKPTRVVSIAIMARSCAAGLKQSVPGGSLTMRTVHPIVTPPSAWTVCDEPELDELTWAGPPLIDA